MSIRGFSLIGRPRPCVSVLCLVLAAMSGGSLCAGLSVSGASAEVTYADDWNDDGPSFDCKTNRAADEIAICGDAELSRLDKEMADLYATAKGQIQPSRAEELELAQKSWLGSRRKCQSDIQCLKDIYRQRLANLQNAKNKASQTAETPELPGKAQSGPVFNKAQGRLTEASAPPPTAQISPHQFSSDPPLPRIIKFTALADHIRNDKKRIRVIQKALKELGLFDGPESAEYDAATDRAVETALEGFSSEVTEDAKATLAAIGMVVTTQRYKWYLAGDPRTPYINTKDELPKGTLKYEYREQGQFDHIVHSYDWTFYDNNRCESRFHFINTSDRSKNANGEIYGRCLLLGMRDKDVNILLFKVVSNNGDPGGKYFTAHSLRLAAYEGGLRDMYISFSFAAYGSQKFLIDDEPFEYEKKD